MIDSSILYICVKSGSSTLCGTIIVKSNDMMLGENYEELATDGRFPDAMHWNLSIIRHCIVTYGIICQFDMEICKRARSYLYQL